LETKLGEKNQSIPGDPNSMVSREVVAQSDVAQGLAPGTNEKYLGMNGGAIAPGGSAPGAGGAITPVSDLQKQIDDTNARILDKQTKANEAIAMVNENPFLAESNRVGRIQKINTNLNASLLVDQTQLKTLTEKATAAAELSKPDTQIISETDNAGNVISIVQDKKTGAVISKTNLGKIGKADKPSTKSDTEISKENKTILVQSLYSQANSYGHVPPEVWNAAKKAWVDDGLGTPDDFEKQFGGLTDPGRKDYGQGSGYQMNKDYRNKLFGL